MVLGPWICQFIGLQSLLSDSLTIKAVKASINVSNVSYKSCALLWYAKKEKYLHEISMFTLTKNFPRLANLSAQIRCAPNPYTAAQIDLKYPLICNARFENWLISFF